MVGSLPAILLFPPLATLCSRRRPLDIGKEYEATEERARPPLNGRSRMAEQIHNVISFLAVTAVRPHGNGEDDTRKIHQNTVALSVLLR